MMRLVGDDDMETLYTSEVVNTPAGSITLDTIKNGTGSFINLLYVVILPHKMEL